MRLIRFDRPEYWTVSPFQHFNTLRDEINRLFETPFGEFDRGNDLYRGWTPALDLYEQSDSFVVTAELPGMSREAIDLSLHEGALTLSGERKFEAPREGEGAVRSERFYGRFHRTVGLPKPVNAAKVKATYRDGILTVTLPKAEEAKPRQIEVHAN